MTTLIWFGIIFCITQSAMFSGLNLAFFSVTKLRLEIESKSNNPDAVKVANFRQDSNFLLTTILWGNVAINVLLLFPVAKPSAVVLDKWLGPEAVRFIKEKEFRDLLKMHMNSQDSDIEIMEGKGALNFLDIDDLRVVEKGEIIDPKSVIQLPFVDDKPKFPEIEPSNTDPFLKLMQSSKKKWVVITDIDGEPKATLNADCFLRGALFEGLHFNPLLNCHRPIIIKDDYAILGEVIPKLQVHPERSNDDVIDNDVILFWGSQKRIVTGSDILGRLMRGIVQNQGVEFQKVICEDT